MGPPWRPKLHAPPQRTRSQASKYEWSASLCLWSSSHHSDLWRTHSLKSSIPRHNSISAISHTSSCQSGAFCALKVHFVEGAMASFNAHCAEGIKHGITAWDGVSNSVPEAWELLNQAHPHPIAYESWQRRLTTSNNSCPTYRGWRHRGYSVVYIFWTSKRPSARAPHWKSLTCSMRVSILERFAEEHLVMPDAPAKMPAYNITHAKKTISIALLGLQAQPTECPPMRFCSRGPLQSGAHGQWPLGASHPMLSCRQGIACRVEVHDLHLGDANNTSDAMVHRKPAGTRRQIHVPLRHLNLSTGKSSVDILSVSYRSGLLFACGGGAPPVKPKYQRLDETSEFLSGAQSPSFGLFKVGSPDKGSGLKIPARLGALWLSVSRPECRQKAQQLLPCDMWVWVKIKPPGGHRFLSMFPFTRVPFWYRFFDPQPCGIPTAHGRTLAHESVQGPGSALQQPLPRNANLAPKRGPISGGSPANSK